MSMTPQERLLWDYIEEESDELMIRVRDLIVQDGYDKAMEGSVMSPETLSLKILSHAMVKTLAVLVEKTNHPSLARAYLELAPMHSELIKLYMLKEKKA